MKDIKLVKCFVASPSDVKAERDCARRIIDSISQEVLNRGVYIQPVMWEHNAVPDIGDDAQSVINRQLNPAENDIVIGVFGKQFGSPTPRAESGTAEEIDSVIAAFNAGKNLHLQVYFSNCPTKPSEIDPIQFQKVKEYKNKIQAHGCLTCDYCSLEEFESQVRKGILAAVDDLTRSEPRNLSPSVQLLVDYERLFAESLVSYCAELQITFPNARAFMV